MRVFAVSLMTPALQICHYSVIFLPCISFNQSGRTISDVHLAKLFKRFYRVDLSRQHNGDGVGLGLAMVKSIIDAHNGTVSVTSVNSTTTFAITLASITG